MPANYVKLTIDTMSELPSEKQIEVYDFAKFLRTTTKKESQKKPRNNSILKLIGIGQSANGDIALNHDKYLFE